MAVSSTGRLLIVGGDALLGRSLAASFPADADVVVTTRRADSASAPHRVFLDLRDPVDDWPIPEGTTVAWLLAAVTSQAECRRDPVGTARVNVEHPVALARRLAERGAFVVFPSTNLVFDGTVPHVSADAPPSPRTEYGRQKTAAESALRELGDRVAIVRLTKVLPPAFPLFVQWRSDLEAGTIIRPFADLRMAPVGLREVAETLRDVGLRRLAGVTHLSASRDVTYAEAAEWIAEQLGAGPLVQPTTSIAAGADLEWRPDHTTLAMPGGQATLTRASIDPRAAVMNAANM